MEEPAFLMPMQRIVGRIEVEDDLLRRFVVRVEEEIDEQLFDGWRIGGDLGIARRLGLAQFQAVERAFCQLPERSQSGRRQACQRARP